MLSFVLFFSSVSLYTISGLIIHITLPAVIMIIGVYFRGLGKVQGTIDSRFSKTKFFSLRPKADGSELSKCYIAKYENNQRKFFKFFKMFVSMWGFSTSIISTAIQIGTYLGLEKLPNYDIPHLSIIPPQYVTHIPTPDTPESFIFWMYLFGIPFAFMILIPHFLLRSTNLRYIKDHHTTIPIPKYDLDWISGLTGIVSFTMIFFKDVLVSSDVQLMILNYVVLDFIIVGIPFVIFCLFYVWWLEPHLKPKILSYLHNDLHIQDEDD